MRAPKPAALALYVVTTASLPEAEIEAFAALLDAEETARATRLPPLHRRDFIAAHGLLRLALSRACAGRPPRAWRFTSSAEGKPAPMEAEGLEVSLSHAQGLALAAVSRCGPVGVDGEPVASSLALPQTAALLSGPEEFAAWSALAPRPRADAFFSLWTLKESLLKAAGFGLTRDPRIIQCGLDPLRVLALDLPARGKWLSWSATPAPGFRLALSVDARFAPEPPDARLVGNAAQMMLGEGTESVTLIPVPYAC